MYIKRRILLIASLLASSWGHALTITPYSPAELSRLQASDAPHALHFHADWCPTCKAQDKSLQTLKADPGLNLTVLSVDYDREAELKKQLGVRSQSTFIVYRGKVEKVRQIGETSPQALRQALSAAL